MVDVVGARYDVLTFKCLDGRLLAIRKFGGFGTDDSVSGLVVVENCACWTLHYNEACHEALLNAHTRRAAQVSERELLEHVHTLVAEALDAVARVVNEQWQRVDTQSNEASDEAVHQVKVGIDAEAEHDERVLFDFVVRLRHRQVQLLKQRHLQVVLEAGGPFLNVAEIDNIVQAGLVLQWLLVLDFHHAVINLEPVQNLAFDELLDFDLLIRGIIVLAAFQSDLSVVTALGYLLARIMMDFSGPVG